jgi:hypothetical protein
MSTHGPRPDRIVVSPMLAGELVASGYGPLAIIADSPTAATLARDTLVDGIVAIRVRHTAHPRTCASEACRMGRMIVTRTTHVRVTYADDRAGEDFHLSCYRWEFIE